MGVETNRPFIDLNGRGVIVNNNKLNADGTFGKPCSIHLNKECNTVTVDCTTITIVALKELLKLIEEKLKPEVLIKIQ